MESFASRNDLPAIGPASNFRLLPPHDPDSELRNIVSAIYDKLEIHSSGELRDLVW